MKIEISTHLSILLPYNKQTIFSSPILASIQQFSKKICQIESIYDKNNDHILQEHTQRRKRKI